MHPVALQSGMFLVVYLEGSLPVCKAISQVDFPVACLVVWEVGCLGDQAGPVPSNFHRTRVQVLALCKGSLINNIPLTQVTRHSSRLDHKAYHRRLEWGIRVRRRRSLCWLSRTARWKLSKDGTLKRENRGQEVA